MRQSILLSIIVTVLVFCLHSPALSMQGQASVSLAKPFKTTLDNGMTVIIEENHSAPVVAFQMWVKVGSADEDENIAGIAHVFEHMLFKGTKKRRVGEIAKEVDEAGGNINAFTSYDHTVYHLVLAGRFFDKGLDLIADAIQNSSFDPDELAKETEVVLEELKMGEDDPSRKLYQKLLDSSYTTHPYKRPVIGFPDTKSAFKDFKPSLDPHKKRTREPEQKKTNGFILNEEIKEARLGLTFHIPDLTHPDIYAIDALALILGQGESSRLYQRLKGKESIVSSISSYAMTPKEPGLFFITSSLETGNVKKTVAAVLEEIARIKYEGVLGAELEKAKLNLESEFIYSRETREGRARQLGYYETSAGGLDYEKRYLEGISKITSSDIRKSIERYLTPENMTIGLMLPKGEKALLTLDEILKTAGASVVETEKSYKEGQGMKGTEAPFMVKGQETIKIKLDNGMTLIVKEDHTNPVVAMYAAVEGGIRFEGEKTNGLSNFIEGNF
ncbi:MAG: insulinase family protein [Deltaproteobacteria bacterium]|nr:insulinase family protein [Deltaproteobacteria bacterium]